MPLDYLNKLLSMKKLLLLIVFIGSVFNAYADGIELPQLQSASITIDSLSAKLEKLQHDYDYMYCDYEAYKLNKDLTDLAHSIDISANGILINVYNSRYDRDLYEVYSENYEASCELLETLKGKIETIKTMVFLKILTSGFTDGEIEMLNASFGVINNTVNKVQKSLDYYDVVLKSYRRNR